MVVGVLSPGEVGGEIFDVDLHPGPVSGEHVQGHAPYFPDHDGLVTVGGQHGLDDVLDSKSQWDRLHPAYQALAANLS